MVVDVGAVYDASQNRYDHHQREFADVLDGFHTKLSSAGLIYKHFGKEILLNIIHEEQVLVHDDIVETCYVKLYESFMEHIDAIDNGVKAYDGEPKYNISSTLSNRVGQLNFAWNETASNDEVNERFREAMLLTATEFLTHALGIIHSWYPARSIVVAAIEQRYTVHESGKIIVLSQACPWKDHLFDIEAAVRHRLL